MQENGKTKLQGGEPMRDALAFLSGLTRKRDSKYLKTLADKVDHVSLGGGDINETIRMEIEEKISHDEALERYKVMLAQLALRVFAVVNFVGQSDDFIKALSKQYAEGEDVETWSINDWQDFFAKKFLEINKQNGGLLFASTRLNSEVQEAVRERLLMTHAANDSQLTEHVQGLLSELADIFAWNLGICNILDINLEQALIDRYGTGCPKCKQYPCECPDFSLEFVSRHDVQGFTE